MTYAQDERREIADLLIKLGPDQPTLCAGWQTADLAAHLVLRERRPDAGAGILGGPLRGYTRRVQSGLTGRMPFAQLVDLVRTGPPRFSFFSLPGADERLNLVEFFVHHEDIRRARSGWEARPLSAELSGLLWDRLSLARFLMRKAPVGVELVRSDAARSNGGTETPQSGNGRVRITVKARTPVVTVTGDPAELTLWAMGRTSVASVRLDGNDSDVAALRSESWRP